jgi:hypothetical protein
MRLHPRSTGEASGPSPIPERHSRGAVADETLPQPSTKKDGAAA